MLPILVIEDDEKISNSVAESIRLLGFDVDQAWNGEVGLERVHEREYALVILDINLPRLNGFEVCRKIREHNSSLPVLILSAQSSEIDRILGLEIGASDYLVKPFNMHELLARVKAILRLVNAVRSVEEPEANQLITIGPLTIDRARRTVTKSGNEVLLTAKEYELLALLVSKPGRPFSRETILKSNVPPTISRSSSSDRAVLITAYPSQVASSQLLGYEAQRRSKRNIAREPYTYE